MASIWNESVYGLKIYFHSTDGFYPVPFPPHWHPIQFSLGFSIHWTKWHVNWRQNRQISVQRTKCIIKKSVSHIFNWTLASVMCQCEKNTCRWHHIVDNLLYNFRILFSLAVLILALQRMLLSPSASPQQPPSFSFEFLFIYLYFFFVLSIRWANLRNIHCLLILDVLFFHLFFAYTSLQSNIVWNSCNSGKLLNYHEFWIGIYQFMCARVKCVRNALASVSPAWISSKAWKICVNL